jgi:16S rRNA (cytidine1402-2'-O)-methyltransferase
MYYSVPMITALYMVATPLGNLQDISARALEILRSVDAILCEDTRVTKILLERYSINTLLVRADAEKELDTLDEVVRSLEEGKSVAYVTDAGTPGISDPGARLVDAVHKAGCSVLTVPGPNAVAAALSVAGLTGTAYTFLGFLPHKKGRMTALKSIADTAHIVVLFESTHRIEKLLQELTEYIGARRVVVCKELTKIYEKTMRGTALEILTLLHADPTLTRGEFVVLIDAH